MFTPPNVSHVICHVSCVTCHMSHVTCHFFFFFFFFLFFSEKLVKFIGGGSVINGAYPVQFQYTSKLAHLLTQAVYTPNQSGVKISEFFSGKSRLATLFQVIKGKHRFYNGGKHEHFDFPLLTRKIGQNWSRVYQKMRNSNIWGVCFLRKVQFVYIFMRKS